MGVFMALLVGTLATCPASYAQNRLNNRSARQSLTPFSNEQSDPAPSVRIKLMIEGVAQDIDVFAFDQQSSYVGASEDAGGGGGAPKPGTLTVSKRIDQFTPRLSQIQVTGQHIREVELQWFRVNPAGNNGDLFFTLKLSDVTISSIHRSLPNQQDPAYARLAEAEALTLSYRNYQMTAAGE